MSDELVKKLFNGETFKDQKEYIETLEFILKRKIDETELKPLPECYDHLDYNESLISRSVDRGVRLFTLGSLKSLKPLDLLKIQHAHLEYLKTENDKREMEESIKDMNYDVFPFCHRIEGEIRSHFILQTSKNDTYDSLMSELEQHITKYMSEHDWNRLKQAINKGLERVKETPINFPEPLDNHVKGVKYHPTKEEQEKVYGLVYDEKFFVDVRKDDADLLALKELVEILKGKEVHPLSISFGFFLKFMPEITQTTHENKNFYGDWFLNNQNYPNEIYLDNKNNLITKTHNPKKENTPQIAKGFDKEDFKNYVPDSLIFKVNKETKKLEKIELGQVPAQRYEISSGALLASLSLHFHQSDPDFKRLWGVKNKKIDSDELFEIDSLGDDLKNNDWIKETHDTLLSEPDYNILVEHFSKKQGEYERQTFMNTNYMDNHLYYVCVPSQVAGPSKEDMVYEYNKYSKNTKTIRAGECYLFEKIEDEIIPTRLYFYPYRPLEVHPFLQHGSVIFGHNDMSYHPCRSEGSALDNNILLDQMRDFLIDHWNETKLTLLNRELYIEPIFSMALFVGYHRKYELMTKDPTELLKPENNDIIIKASEGVYAYSPLMLFGYDLATVIASYNSHPLYRELFGLYGLQFNMLKNLMPFNERFQIWKYKDDFKGISSFRNNTFFINVAKDMSNERTGDLLKVLYQRKKSS